LGFTVDTNVRRVAPASDRELLDATRAGDSAAFADLYDRYHLAVYRIADRMLGDWNASEDVVQSVFMSLWKSPPDFRADSFPGWLACVARNRTRDALRSRHARRESAWPEHLAVADSLADDVSRRAEDARVRTAVAALPETQRALIELGFFGERSHAELAELTSLPLGTVKTRIRAGLQRLRFALDAAAVAV
jgi:RNA polymerase sigma-70 factor (ECF subfamily)